MYGRLRLYSVCLLWAVVWGFAGTASAHPKNCGPDPCPDSASGSERPGTLFYSSVNPTPAGPVDDYMSLWDHAGSSVEANEDEFSIPVYSITGSNLACKIIAGSAPGIGQNAWVITLRESGADTAVTCAIDELATSCADTTNEAQMATGASINLKVSSAGPDGNPANATNLTCIVYLGLE